MKDPRTIFVILATLLSGPAVFATTSSVRVGEELFTSQVLFVDLEDLTRGLFKSRLRIRLSEALSRPSEVRVTHPRTTDEDAGGAMTILQGSPLIATKMEIDEVDARGEKTKTHFEEGTTVEKIFADEPLAVDFFPEPVASFRVRGLGNSLTVVDSSGRRGLLNIDVKLQPLFFFAPTSRRYVLRDEPAAEIRISIAELVPGQTYAKSPTFVTHEQAVPEAEAKSRICRTAGEVIAASPLVVGPGLRVQRAEACLADDHGGVERVVVITQNPPHQPKRDQDLIAYSALNRGRGGRLSDSPLVALTKENVADYNCHGYALTSTIGTGKIPGGGTWIQAEDPPVYTLGTRPYEAILRRNFDEILSVKSDYHSTTAEEDLSRDERLREGDLIAFYGGGGFPHSGVVRRSPDGQRWWVESKFDEGPVLLTPFESVHDVIPNLYTHIRIFRPRR